MKAKKLIENASQETAEARHDAMATAVYNAARGVLEAWGIAVDASGDYKSNRVGEAIDEGLADDLWEWVLGRVPETLAEVDAA